MAFTAASFDRFVNNTVFTVLDALNLNKNKPDMVRSLYREVPWNPAGGDTVQFTSLTLPTYGQRVDEQENIPTQNPVEGDRLTKRMIEYASRFDITYKMAKFNKYDEVVRFAESLARQMKDSLDLELTIQIFNEADQTTFTPKNKPAVSISTGDGLALQSASHTVQGTGSTTYSNSATAAALSVDNLATAQQQGEANTVDDFGTSLSPNFDTLIIPNNAFMRKKALELTGSELSPEDNNNAVNVYSGGTMKVVVLTHGCRNGLGAYSTDNRYAWAIFDSNMVKDSFQYMVAEEPTVHPPFVNADNLNRHIVVTQFAAFGVPRWQGTVYNRSTTQP